MSGNQLAGKHALGARARKLKTTGALVVRFEMPFAVWCDNCKPHPVIIGQGVRFNAEKTKVGNYYTTAIYSFRMKHTVCGETIEIRTDPQHTDYVVTEGGRRRDTGDDKPLQPGEIAIKPYGSTQDPAEKDPFSKLEGKMEDKTRAKTEASRILELQKAQDKTWEDPYTKNQALRRTFRAERKIIEKKTAANDAFKEKHGLDIDMPDETEMDRQKASLIQFGAEDPNATETRAERAARLKPMFPSPVDLPRKTPTPVNPRISHRTQSAIDARKAAWNKEILDNARATRNPFGSDWETVKAGLKARHAAKQAAKRQRKASKASPDVQSDAPKAVEPKPIDAPAKAPAVAPKSLVDYSDSD